MKVLSADIGWKHLAYAYFEIENELLTLHDWKIVDLIDSSLIPNINKATLDSLIKDSALKIKAVVDEWTLLSPDIVYLENQPLGPMARNTKTKSLSHIFQAMLVCNGISVAFVSPSLKLRGMETKGSYAENKKFAVASCTTLLEECGQIQWKNWFLENKGKKDDLADALLQGYHASKQAQYKSTTTKKNPNKKIKIEINQIPKSPKNEMSQSLGFIVPKS
jgi:hypothetical protein